MWADTNQFDDRRPDQYVFYFVLQKQQKMKPTHTANIFAVQRVDRN